MNVIEQLLAKGPVLTNGAWGTQLQERGLRPEEVPDVWNLTHPDRVEEVARAYVEAGSQVILTNTFRANRIALGDNGLGGQTEEINRAGVELARQAAGDNVRVFASIGPSGRMLFAGDVTEDDLFEVFREQAEALTGADALLVETMSDLDEALIALRAARETGLPVVASMVFDHGRQQDRTMTGATPEKVAQALEEGGADVVGANCGLGIRPYVEVCRRLHAATARPIWIKPNAGMPEIVDGRPTYRMTPEEFASYVPALLEAGANFVGGCCGSTPAFIRACAEALAATRTP